jgi:hypothetical protein
MAGGALYAAKRQGKNGILQTQLQTANVCTGQ